MVPGLQRQGPSWRTFHSQPSIAFSLQSRNAAEHVYPHMPAVQVGIDWAGVGQRLPHIPQFPTLVLTSTQTMEQQVSVPAHFCCMVQPGVQVLSMAQIDPSGQSVSWMQPTHVLVAGSQIVIAVQSD